MLDSNSYFIFSRSPLFHATVVARVFSWLCHFMYYFFKGRLDKISWTDDGQLLAVSTQLGKWLWNVNEKNIDVRSIAEMFQGNIYKKTLSQCKKARGHVSRTNKWGEWFGKNALFTYWISVENGRAKQGVKYMRILSSTLKHQKVVESTFLKI